MEHLYPLKHFPGNTFSPSLSSVYTYFTYMIGLTNGHMSHQKCSIAITFCDSIVRFDWCRTKRIDSVCGVTWIPLCARDGSVVTRGRGEGETLSHHVVYTSNRHKHFKSYLILEIGTLCKIANYCTALQNCTTYQ